MDSRREATLVPSMLDYIREIPAALARAAATVPQQAAAIVARAGKVSRVEIVGSGTSLHAGISVRDEIEDRLSVDVRVSTPSEYLESNRSRVSAGTLLLAISQTGRSTGTINAIEDARERGAFTVLVTGWPDSAGARAADASLDITSGPEWVGARTKGYVATLYAMLALSDALAADTISPDERVESVDVVEAARTVIREAEEALPELADALGGAPAIWMVSAGRGMATAREAALKMLETVRIPLPVFDVEEYMHGPYHCLEANTFVILILPSVPSRPRLERLEGFIADKSERLTVVAHGEKNGRNLRETRFAVTPNVPPRVEPLLGIIPFQMLSSELTWRKGREPGVSRYPDFHDQLGSKTAAPKP